MQAAPLFVFDDDNSELQRFALINDSSTQRFGLDKSRSERTYVKCDRCRHDKQKCIFEGESSICKRCNHRDYHCSGPKRAYRKRKATAEHSEPSLPISHEQWAKYKDIFTNYYIVDGLTLKEAMGRMETLHGFQASRRQYERRIAEWNLQKNARAGDKQSYTDLATNSPRASLAWRLTTMQDSVPPTTYTYVQGLEHGQFRLLRLLPGEEESPLHGQMVISSWSTKENYCALSYSWSHQWRATLTDSNPSANLIIEEATLPIPVNLYQALLAVRRREFEQLLWVDAVCINQQDSEERNLQVGMMAEIYRQAARVIVCLNLESNTERLVREIVQETQDLHTLDLFMQQPNVRWKASALVSLFENTYWREIWTVQNILVAKDVRLMIDDTEIPLENVWETIEVLDRYGTKGIPMGGAVYRLARLRDNPEHGPDFTLSELLVVTRNCKMEDPRDRMYVVLSLARDTNYDDLKVDYSADFDLLITKVIGLLLRETISIETIWKASLPIHIDSPSWVTGWKQDGSASFIPYDGPAIYHASKLVEGILRLDNNVLFVMGYNFDKVEHCGDMAITDGLPSTWFEIAGWMNTQDEVPDHFWRLLVADRAAMGQPVPSWFKRACQNFFSSFRCDQQAWAVTMVDTVESIVIREFLDRVNEVIHGRRMIRTTKGYVGLAPAAARAGDHVCIILGTSVPIVMRESHEKWYEVIGQSYVHNLMQGEALDRAEKEDIQLQEFEIR